MNETLTTRLRGLLDACKSLKGHWRTLGTHRDTTSTISIDKLELINENKREHAILVRAK